MVICLKRGANGPAYATAAPIMSCFIKIQTGLTFLVPAYTGFRRKEVVKRVSCRITCVSRHPKLRTGGFSWSSFTGYMPLLTAASAPAPPT